ncbi:type III secretion system protein [Erwinia tracheiphila]|uniref:Type III secretion system protein n=1 Tax=Erwinia tracheiphila TaxID=65700 RepID=A0A0M2KHK4_9GAMM|nr:hypothetical protein [Erwinia tracheiphila]EOS94417.1 type III secretion system protein [Erwinia tracheiphila PSU-1]KKF36738.1 hypothetical protein SY86_16995 [Erwinia tracheiphila]UIA88073.1 type III secretion system protein [Erwinia tracheiphila]UIA96666.1 type III secretion system protein [Erwinia tracheiphila]
MNAWRDVGRFISTLERKQRLLQNNIHKTKRKIDHIGSIITQQYEEFAGINQEIKRLTPSGVVNRHDLYQGIRRQGALLTHQQVIIQKITQLKQDQRVQEKKMQQYRVEMNLLDKRHHKMSDYLQKAYRLYLKQRANRIENDIQEMAVYVNKDY